MTRILSEILQAHEPVFRMRLRQLEQISGHQNTDIKLSVEITQAVQRKVHQLGLDKHDTTPLELYQALRSRLSADDTRLERSLRTLAAQHTSAEANLMDGLQLVLSQDAAEVTSFGVKPAALKRLLKHASPKRVVKQLGYRSVDAMLRHESAPALIAAGFVLESAAWRRSWLDSYKQLKPTDFEEKAAQVLFPTGVRWQLVTEKMLESHGASVIGLAELAAVIVLPLPAERPQGIVVATLATALAELNSVAATSTYLRASQVQADFANRVKAAASGTVALSAPMLEQAMPWQVVQQYFAKLKVAVNEDVFGPYVQSADFMWHNIEERLAEICPSMEFWRDSQYLSSLHGGKAVSLNVLDAAINTCNNWAYESRSSLHAQQALWHELTLRYLDRESLEQTIINTLQPQLAMETANK